ncbi:replication initiation protein [Fusobacterium sp.]|uniref:replication initiation protein n=1 Tax=Fusobacterium sp. TaxID=68766 RepID=UPI0025BE70EF|nr:replication initiation protein [Fusobacterium sp.]
MKNIKNIFVDINVRTSRLEDKIFQIILEKIKKNIEKNEKEYTILTFKQEEFEVEEKEIEQGLKGLMNKGLKLSYLDGEKENVVSFNYVAGYQKINETFTIFVVPSIINSFTKNSFEYGISLRTFFYLRKKIVIKFMNLLIKNIEQDREIEIELEELKDLLEISNDSYERFFDFEKNILKPLVEKLNTFSNFTIKYDKIKKGENKNNKVIGIRFTIHNIEIEKNRGETNYLIQIIKNMVQDYRDIWEEVNASIQNYGFESTKRNLLFLKENGFEISDNEIKNYLRNDGRNIEEILKLSDHILIKEKYSIYKDIPSFIKIIYDTIIAYDFYYSLNFKFLSVIKNYIEGETLYYKDSTYIIYGKYKNNKGFFKIFESKERK